MKERPILMSAPMVRALLAGTKTQTRRAIKAPGIFVSSGTVDGHGVVSMHDNDIREVHCPYGQPGNRLWVRETFAIVPRTAYRCSEGVQQTLRVDDPYEHDAAIYRQGWTRSKGGFRWRPSIHMPRWASRITLELTEVRVERLQAISDADALAEGIERLPDGGYGLPGGSHYHFTAPRISYWSLWDAINGQGSTEANPWVWALTFKRIQVPA